MKQTILLGFLIFTFLVSCDDSSVSEEGLETPQRNMIVYGANSIAFYSEDDGETWTEATGSDAISASSTLFGGVCDKETAVVGSTQGIIISEDGGKTWEAADSSIRTRSIAFGNSTFVTFNDNDDTVYFSEDGRNWESTGFSVASCGGTAGMAYGAGHFFGACAAGNILFYSSDLENWTEDTSFVDTRNPFEANGFVFFSDGTSNIIYRVDSDLNIQDTNNTGATELEFGLFSDGVFYGNNGSDIFTSTDGANYTSQVSHGAIYNLALHQSVLFTAGDGGLFRRMRDLDNLSNFESINLGTLEDLTDVISCEN